MSLLQFWLNLVVFLLLAVFSEVKSLPGLPDSPAHHNVLRSRDFKDLRRDALLNVTSIKGFYDVVEALYQFDENVCGRDQKKIELTRELSLKLLNEALASFHLPKMTYGARDIRDEVSFRELVKRAWRNLLSPSRINFQETMISSVDTSIRNGVIPLPVLSDNTSGDLPDPFNYTALRIYFYLGITPVSLGQQPQELIARLEHPFIPEVFETTWSLAGHDLVHAEFTSEVFDQFDLKSQTSCQSFKECLDSIPGEDKTPGLPSGEVRKAIFYILHEDSTPIQWPDFCTVDRSVLFEGAFERTIKEKSHVSEGEIYQFDLNDLITSDGNPKQVCAYLYSIKAPMNPEISFESTEFSQMIKSLIPENIASILVGSGISEQWLLNGRDSDLSQIFEMGIFRNLIARCEARFYGESKINRLLWLAQWVDLHAGKEKLKANMEEFAMRGFRTALGKNIKNLASHVCSIQAWVTDPSNDSCSFVRSRQVIPEQP